MGIKVNGKTQSFKNYIADVLQNSIVTGIPQIAGAVTTPKKIVRTLVFILCVVGFLYQTLTFLYMYWEYPVIVDVQISAPQEADYPAITFCNINGIQRTRYCAKNKCFPPENPEKLCCEKPRYCDNNGKLPDDFLIPNPDILREMDEWPAKDLVDYLQPFNKMMPVCLLYFANENKNFQDCNMTAFVKSVRCQAGETFSTACYTMNSLLGEPNAKPQVALSNAAYIIGMEPQGMEYNEYSPEVYLQIAVHSPYTVVNPFIDGFILHPGKSYTIRMKKAVKSLLPAPYMTNCTDYIQMWRDRGGRGPTTEKECLLECQVNVSMEMNNCVDQNIKLPNNERKCKFGSPDETLFRKAAECGKNCRPACWEESYEITKDETSVGAAEDCKGVPDRGREATGLRINFNHMETTTYLYKPQYENVETFSYIGGYIGMWLGISLVAVFDFCETIFLMMRYPLGKMRYYFRLKFRRKLTRVRRIHQH